MNPIAEEWLSKAVELKNKGKYKEAEPLYYKAIIADPTEYETYLSLGKFYYLIPDQYHSVLNYIRAAHLSVRGGIRNEITKDPVFQLFKQNILEEYHPLFLMEVQEENPWGWIILMDFNLCTNLGHTIWDLSIEPTHLDPEILKQTRVHKKIYKDRFSNMQRYRELDPIFERNFYSPLSAKLLLKHLDWQKIQDNDGDKVLEIYLDDYPRYTLDQV